MEPYIHKSFAHVVVGILSPVRHPPRESGYWPESTTRARKHYTQEESWIGASRLLV